jgi:hypothetical protein
MHVLAPLAIVYRLGRKGVESNTDMLRMASASFLPSDTIGLPPHPP